MQIDCYGFDATSVNFQRRKLHPYIIKHDGTVYYICFSDADKRPIHRITLIEETGETIIEWAYGRWDNVELTLFEPLCRFEVGAKRRIILCSAKRKQRTELASYQKSLLMLKHIALWVLFKVQMP